jgi:hypothetical protein
MKRFRRLTAVLAVLALPCLCLNLRADRFLDTIDAVIAMHEPFTTSMTGPEKTAFMEQVDDAVWGMGYIFSDLEMIVATGYGSYTLNPQFHKWMKDMMVGVSNAGHSGMFTAQGIVDFIGTLGLDPAQGDFQQRMAILRQLIQDYPEVLNDLTQQEKDALDQLLDDLDDAALLLRAGGSPGAPENWEEALRQRMGGFSPFSAPIQLSRNLMNRNLLRNLDAGCGGVPAVGLQAWGDDWELDEEDGINLAVNPYYCGGNETTQYSIGLPLFWTSIDEMESDSFWAVALDSMVRQELGGGFFVGGHLAGVSNYAEMLDDNQFFSLAGGPFAGWAVPVSERIVASCAVLSEGIYTEKADATWYVSGGVGVSALLHDGIVLHLFGSYYRTMDTYTEDDDADFFDLGGALDFAVGERTCLSIGASTISGADGADSVTVSIGIRRGL